MDSFLFKSHVHALDSVIVVVGMFIQNCLNFDRKKLSCRRLVSVFQPSVIARFADLQHAAHGVDAIFFLVIQDEYVSLTGLYLFRSFAKKPSASFKILFALRNSAFSFKLAVSDAKLVFTHCHRFLRLVLAMIAPVC